MWRIGILSGLLLFLSACDASYVDKAADEEPITQTDELVEVSQTKPSIPAFNATVGSSFEVIPFVVTVNYPEIEEYSSSGLVVPLGWAPADLALIGRPIRISPSTSDASAAREVRQYTTLDEAVTSNIDSLVVNAGLLSGAQDRSGEIEGLLMINRAFIQPFSDDRRFSGVLCLEPQADQITIFRSAWMLESPDRVRARCVSAIQEIPIIVNSGRVAINRTELERLGPQSRVVIGINKRNRRFLMIFEEPVHLYSVADILVNGENENLSLGSTVSDEAAKDFIGGARAAINLPGGASSFVAINGQSLTGKLSAPARTVMIVTKD